MKTKIILFAVIVIFSSCLTIKNKTITDDRTQRKELIGTVTRKGFQKSEFKDWFNKGYSEYVPDKDVINKLKDVTLYKGVKIKTVFGTWCGDSRRELPRFYKITDEANIPEDIIELIAVDTEKSSGNKNLEEIKFTRIPTFIFYKNGKEIGRIVESTKESLEKDMLNILLQGEK
ncbi:MAG: thioredoxin family protein [Bacteroidales bacterium]|nr:thioredoxin family protein [Bacteroidales bacterium]